MISVFKERTHQYLTALDLKSKIKTEECQEKTLKSELEELQREVSELNGSISIIKWKIRHAEFVMSCEKDRHKFYYDLIKTAENEFSTNSSFQEIQTTVLNFKEYRRRLEDEKLSLTKQLEYLKH